MDPNDSAKTAERLAALRDYQILDTLAERDYDDITELAAALCDTAISLVSLVDEKRQWFKSCFGLNVTETPVEWAFCSHAIQTPGEMFIVPDAHKDPRFSNNPLVTGDPHIRFYAGMPLLTSSGHALGTLCVLDTVPRELSPRQQKTLKTLTRQVVALLELNHQVRLRNEAEARFLSAIEAMQEGLVLQERSGEITLCNPQAERILGLTMDQMRGKSSLDPCWRAIHEDGSPFPGETHPAMQALKTGQRQKDILMGVHKPNDELTWISINASPLFRASETTPFAVVTTFSDISARKRNEEEQLALLQKLATTDGLTGLNNHRKFQEDLCAYYHLSIRYQHPLSLLLLDVDHFKSYNDTFGHPAGDVVLNTIAATLTQSKRASDIIARYGGEELAVILPETGLEGALVVAERLRAAVEDRVDLKRPVTISIGVATLMPTTIAPEALIDQADRALYASKRRGRNCVTHFGELAALSPLA